MTARVLMVQGTASHVGKSVLVTALCRILRQDGFRVAPFKAQNMSLNSSVTADGGEIGRAQAVQADAAGVEPTVDMNPVLIKPEGRGRSQIVLMGKPFGHSTGRDQSKSRLALWQGVTASLDRLREAFDVVVIEGAGSPAEVNIKHNDIANMPVATYAGAPVLLVADIDPGGVFASIIGTLELLEPDERALVRGLVINKFRGDPVLFESGVAFLEERTGVPVAGVIPYFTGIDIPQEDSVSLERPARSVQPSVIDVAVVRLPHISNFDDFDPLAREPGVAVRYVESAEAVGDPDLLILPGTKTTIEDLQWLKGSSLDRVVKRLAESGKAVFGICGGYQMLGRDIRDPLAVESQRPDVEGLGLLPVSTTFTATKETHRIRGRVATAKGVLATAGGAPLEGYEIHMGRTTGPDSGSTFRITERSGDTCDEPDGAISPSGYVIGTYVYALFHNAGSRRALLERLAEGKGVSLPPPAADHVQDLEYDRLAALVRGSLRMDLVYRMAGLEVSRS